MSETPQRDDDASVLWHLLPDDPVGFFGLDADFDRQSLKRAYNALLRRYKPDKYPEEFKKLRAAFEQLDGQLRYGQAPQSPLPSRIDQADWRATTTPKPDRETPADSHNVLPADKTQPAEPQAADTHSREPSSGADLSETAQPPESGLVPLPQAQDQSKTEQPPRPKTLHERIESESLVSLYEELKQNPRQPFDYYVLALLSDAVAEPKDLLFLDWLLRGLKAFPNQPALIQLLTAYFRDGDLPDEQLSTILIRMSQLVPSDRFYFLTEKLFDRLLLCQPWAHVEEIMARCAANISDHQIRARVVFTCHLIRRALWLAPMESCDKLIEFVNQHYEYLEGNLEYEQEVNSLLASYVRSREQFVNKGPMAQMIDSALRSYCLDNEGRGDFEIVRTQAYIAHNPAELFREIRLTPDEDMQLLTAWIWISNEVEDRLETQAEPPERERLVVATFQMLQQIDQNFPATPIQFYTLASFLVPVSISLILMFVPPLLAFQFPYSSNTSETIAGLLFAGGFILAILYVVWLQKHTTSVWLINYLRRTIEKHYLLWWRSLVARFFAATHFSYRDVDRAIDAVLQTRRGELNICHWLPHFYNRDPAMYVYATSVRFLR